MTHLPKLLNAIAQLLSYPDDSTVQTAELLYVVLKGELDSAAADIAQFGSYAETCAAADLEESYTRTFDINPLSALEVGWHLFGEEYARGMFLVRMREELRKYALPESHELPDHMTHVLAVVAAMPEAEATRFVRACVQPAVEQMDLALRDTDSPYRHVLHCLARLLKYVWGAPLPLEQSSSAAPSTRRAFECDPLHAYPVADVPPGCGSGNCGAGDCGAGGHEHLQFVPLQIEIPVGISDTTQANSIPARKS